eukprot:TRINITY_DN1081_c0_g3_i1.p1 TRINITY_DN1081_c0_g3~~TRINITY_DN1081_c0_g3_i1.p1  ORF type:complete len:490 (+),score=41.67 TRINITY_DN1081_c0_g3_i1:118-1470(+)
MERMPSLTELQLSFERVESKIQGFGSHIFAGLQRISLSSPQIFIIKSWPAMLRTLIFQMSPHGAPEQDGLTVADFLPSLWGLKQLKVLNLTLSADFVRATDVQELLDRLQNLKALQMTVSPVNFPVPAGNPDQDLTISHPKLKQIDIYLPKTTIALGALPNLVRLPFQQAQALAHGVSYLPRLPSIQYFDPNLPIEALSSCHSLRSLSINCHPSPSFLNAISTLSSVSQLSISNFSLLETDMALLLKALPRLSDLDIGGWHNSMHRRPIENLEWLKHPRLMKFAIHSAGDPKVSLAPIVLSGSVLPCLCRLTLSFASSQIPSITLKSFAVLESVYMDLSSPTGLELSITECPSLTDVSLSANAFPFKCLRRVTIDAVPQLATVSFKRHLFPHISAIQWHAPALVYASIAEFNSKDDSVAEETLKTLVQTWQSACPDGAFLLYPSFFFPYL